MADDHGPRIKDDRMYEMLREAGASKEKAARIANAQAAGTIDHHNTHLDNRTREELYAEAKEIAIEGRSQMDKSELIDAIREH